jgi:hypothetical protein
MLAHQVHLLSYKQYSESVLDRKLKMQMERCYSLCEQRSKAKVRVRC